MGGNGPQHTLDFEVGRLSDALLPRLTRRNDVYGWLSRQPLDS